jgi:hypothetical protein
MPTGGPVLAYPVTQGTDAQNQPYLQIQPQPPGAGWTPEQIVQGFLTASANFGNYPQVARQYLTPTEQSWDPFWSAVVYKEGPDVSPPTYPSGAKNATRATVRIGGTIQANLLGNGNYSVPSASTPSGSPDTPPPFQLVKVHGQWRISSAPQELLLTSNSFENDYQLRDLYFFDPQSKVLVPDPVYEPLGSSGNLMDRLVSELISPPDDWLSYGATKTAFPPKTKVSSVELDGVTAVVSLTGAAIAKANSSVMEQVSAQLLSTLFGAEPSGANGQGVKSVEVVVNAKPWVPTDNQGSPVQTTPKWTPAPGKSTSFYYVSSTGYLMNRKATGGKPVSLEQLGIGSSPVQIAVSADGTYLAALRGSTLYTGLIGGKLTNRGTGFTSMSWDANDDLWVSQGGQILLFRGRPNVRQPLVQMVSVDVVGTQVNQSFTTLRVAPDGVRVAIVSNGNELTFGAISRELGENPRITLSPVQETPLTQVQSVPAIANFTSLSWYGPDYVIALAEPGPSVTEYPVSGGTPQPGQADPDMQTITASAGEPLIAGFQQGHMKADASLNASWMTINDGDTPAVGSAPTYPG